MNTAYALQDLCISSRHISALCRSSNFSVSFTSGFGGVSPAFASLSQTHPCFKLSCCSHRGFHGLTLCVKSCLHVSLCDTALLRADCCLHRGLHGRILRLQPCLCVSLYDTSCLQADGCRLGSMGVVVCDGSDGNDLP